MIGLLKRAALFLLGFCCITVISRPIIAQGNAGLPTPQAPANQDVNAASVEHPNVIVILTDDQGWGDLSCHGNTNLSTPNIDSLARVGARFDRFFVCPVCSPTRAEFLTGRYHPRGGVNGVSEGNERLDLDERTIAQHFRAAGYATACYGKWHNGSQYPYHPLARGFDDYYGFTSGHWGDYFSPPLDRNGHIVKGDGFIVDDFTNNALKFIESNANNKFFLYLALPTPHSPMQAPQSYWQRHRDRNYSMHARDQQKEDISFTRAAMAMVENIDDNVGRLLTKLDHLGLSRKTVVTFFCDNGPNSDRWNDDMKGRKGSTDEGGVRSPLFISLPGTIPQGRLLTQICGAIDLLPTLADLANVPIVTEKRLDGVSLKPLITGEKVALPDRLLFSHWNRQVSVRSQQYRLDARGQLFDMVADPGQRTNIAEQKPVVARELQLAANRFRNEVLTELDSGPRPFTVGHPDFHSTILPARDAKPHGNIQRSAKAPNCSYFTGWTSSEDSITWLTDVPVAGRFSAEVYYACPESAVGTELELGFGGRLVRATVETANNPAALGAEHDLVPRQGESYVKDFKPLKLGILEMAEGSDELRLRAPHIVGEQGVEVRMLVLRRVP